MRQALVKNGIVENVVIADAEFVADYLVNQYDQVIDLEAYPDVGPGYTYDGQVFTPPAEIAVNPETQAFKNIQFGQKLMADFSLLNQSRGLSDAQKYQLAQNLSGVVGLLASGDLKAVLGVLKILPVDGVLLTQPIVDSFIQAIQSFLEAAGS